MSKDMHTPPPWEVKFYDYGDEVWFGGESCGMWLVGPAILGGEGKEPGGLERMEADARLIAAAPEMLDALRAASSRFREYEASHRAKGAQDKADRNQQMAEYCEAAIAKATGGDA